MNKPMKEQLQQAFKDYWAEQEKYTKRKKHKKKRKVKKVEQPVKRKPERLSEYDLRELMGQNRPTYSRGKGGAYRQK